MTGRILKLLFEHQYSEKNRELQKVIDTVHARYAGRRPDPIRRQGGETDAGIQRRRRDPPFFS